MGSVFSKAPRTARTYPTRSSLSQHPTARDPAYPSTIAKPQFDKPEWQRQEGQEGQEDATTANTTSHDDPSSAADPSLAAHLRKLGPVTPYPTRSNTSTFNSSPLDDASSSFPVAAARAADSVITGNGSPTPPTPLHQAIHRTNPALTILEARERLARQAEDEIDGYVGNDGRRFVSVGMLREIVDLRGRGSGDEGADGAGSGARHALSMEREEDGEIEKRFGLKRGIVGKLGEKGIVESV